MPFLLSFTHQTVKPAILTSGKCLVAPPPRCPWCTARTWCYSLCGSSCLPFCDRSVPPLAILWSLRLFAPPKLDRHFQMSIYMWCLFAFSHDKLHLFKKKIFIHQTPGHMAVLFLLGVLTSTPLSREED